MAGGISTLAILGSGAIVIVAAILTAILIIVLLPGLTRYALARPSARSSHRTPTPQGGGLAIVAATLVTVGAALTFTSLTPSASASLLIIGAAIVVMTGL